MRALLERFGGFLPTVIALTLPVLFLPSAGDSYVLPRASTVIAGACLGLALALLVPGGSLGRWRWPLLAAAAAAALAFAFSVSWALGLAGSYTRYESLPMRLAYLAVAASTALLLRTRRQRDAVVAAYVFSTSVASLEAVQQALGHATFRPDGNLGNANLLAALIAMGVPLAIDRGLNGGAFVAAWWGGAAAMAAGLVVTTSRSGVLGVVAACAVIVTLSAPRRLWLPVGAVCGSGLAAVLAFFLLSPLRSLNDDPASLRLDLWRDGLRMIAARPLTGYGEDATGLSFGRFLSHDYASLVTFDRVHAGPLDIAATQGLIGLAALGWVLWVLTRAAWRARGEPHVRGLAAALAGYTVWVLFNFDWAPATGAFWLLAGTLWSSTTAPALEQGMLEKGSSVTGHATTVRALGAIALVLLATPLAAFPVLADGWYLKGRADLAVSVDPLQAQYHRALGEGLVGDGDLRGGVAELQRAADLGETDPTLYVELGDRSASLGDKAAARRAYRRALEIDPYFTPASQRLAALG